MEKDRKLRSERKTEQQSKWESEEQRGRNRGKENENRWKAKRNEVDGQNETEKHRRSKSIHSKNS